MLKEELELVYESVEESGSYESVVEAIDPQWLEESLLATGKASIRQRRLPAQQAIWLVIWMGLIRNQSIKEVCSAMDLALQPNESSEWSRVAPSVITDCRKRLSDSPMHYLFKTAISSWLPQALGQPNDMGLHVLAVDGTTFRCQDSVENADKFGFISKTHRPYPQLRLVSLMAVETRMILSAAFDACHVGEVSLARQLQKDVPDNSLTLFDRCYFSADLFTQWQQSGQCRHWLTPIKNKMRYDVVEEYAENDFLIDMPVSPQARKKKPSLPEKWRARFIAYQEPKGEIKGFITSLTDPKAYPLESILDIYWQRWEIEESYGELKQTQLQNKVTLRSRFVEGVKQELWGVLIAYNLVRLEMASIAHEANVEPTRISFSAAISLIDTQLRWLALSPDRKLPDKLKQMRADIKHFILPKKRKHRTFPRSVLYIPSRYPLRYKK